MRSFLTIWFREWKRGDATNKDVEAAWSAIAKLVERGIDMQMRDTATRQQKKGSTGRVPNGRVE
jgi:hypothetical protein